MIVQHTATIVSLRSRLHSYTAASVNETALTAQFTEERVFLIGSPVVKHDGYWQCEKYNTPFVMDHLGESL